MDNNDFKKRLESIQGITLSAVDTSKFNSSVLHMKQENVRIDKSFDEIINANAKRNRAVIETAENTKQINDKVKSIEETVSAERLERKNADNELQGTIDNIRKAQRFANLKALIVGIACAAAGVAFTIIATKCGWL